MKWLEEAAKTGDCNGMNSSGLRYSSGHGCVKDDKKVAEYFQQASEKGHRYAFKELGNCCYEGAGVPRNLETARTHFKKASDLNNPAGDVNLGAMMFCGEGGASEVENKGFTLIEKAAEDGSEYAAAHLGKSRRSRRSGRRQGSTSCLLKLIKSLVIVDSLQSAFRAARFRRLDPPARHSVGHGLEAPVVVLI